MRVGVAGGGVFGLAAAWELARRGHRVELFERTRIPAPDAAGTDVSKAIRAEYGTATPLYGPLVSRALVRWRALEVQAGERLLEQPGVLFLASAWNPSRFEHASVVALKAIGHAVEVLPAADAARRFPQFLFEGMEVGVFDPQGGWLHAARAVLALAAAARAAGATIAEETPVEAVGDGTLRAGGETRAYDAVVVSAGPWVKRLLPDLGERARITRQQISLYRPADPSPFDGARFPVWVHDIVEEGWYGFPATRDGRVKVSLHRRSQEVDPDVSRAADPDFLEASRAFVVRSLPALDPQSPIEGRACLYTNSPRGDLVVDRAPGRARTFLAGCGSGHGFKFGPVLGELAADLVEKDEVPAFLRLAERRETEVW